MKDIEAVEMLADKNGNFARVRVTDKFLNQHLELKEFLDNRYEDYDSYGEVFHRLRFNIEERPTCHNCGGRVRYVGLVKGSMNNGFQKFCCPKCSADDMETQIKHEDRCMEHFGCRHQFQSDIVREKSKKTLLEHYGVDSPLKSEIIKDRMSKTNHERYGVDNVFQTEEVKEKTKVWCTEKFDREHYVQTDDFRRKYEASNQRNFGVKYPTQSKEIYEKLIQTKKNNQTLTTSKIEKELSSLLDCKGIRYIRQYKSERYPYHVDFYFPDVDLYLEIQGTWTHGGHAFDESSIEDLEKLRAWRDKAVTSKYYKKAIDVWTRMDVEKRKTAKSNNLHYLEVFSIKVNDVLDMLVKEGIQH